jgi:hypothetical protein
MTPFDGVDKKLANEYLVLTDKLLDKSVGAGIFTENLMKCVLNR